MPSSATKKTSSSWDSAHLDGAVDGEDISSLRRFCFWEYWYSGVIRLLPYITRVSHADGTEPTAPQSTYTAMATRPCKRDIARPPPDFILRHESASPGGRGRGRIRLRSSWILT